MKEEDKQTQQLSANKTQQKAPIKERKVNDVIYDFIYHDQLIWDIIDTPQFQRLRKLKKLECLEYVCPSATHSRYEHSVGSAYLAKLFINTLINNNKKAYKQSEKQEAVKTITVAALLYGIGYAPFHHAFENQIVSEVRKNNQEWTLELASIAIFDRLLKSKQSLKSKLTQNQINRIKDLIKGESQDKVRPWQFDLINNKQYGIDIDKLEGFRRDAFYLGNKNLYIQNELLINEARIVDEKLAYPIKHIQIIYNIFDTRYKFYKEYYFNITSMGIEQMICEILELTKDRFQLEQACDLHTHLDDYLKLNDSIISKIKYTSFIKEQLKEAEELKQPSNKLEQMLERSEKACSILKHLNQRKIYKLVKQLMYYIDEENLKEQQKFTIKETKKMLQKDNILNQIQKRQKDLKGKICLTLSDGFGVALTNPLKKVNFFKIDENQMKIQTQIQKLGKRYESVPIQRSIKFYIKQSSADSLKKAFLAIDEFSQFFNNKCKTSKINKYIYIYQGKTGKNTTVQGPRLELATIQQSSNPAPI